MKIAKGLLLLPLVLVLSACATMKTNQPVTPDEKSAINSTHVMLNTTQREIVLKHNNFLSDSQVDPYNPMDSGAIVHHNEGYRPNSGNIASDAIAGLIVTSVKYSQAKNTANTMIDVHNAVSGYDYVQQFNNQLKTKLTTVPWLHVKKQDLRYNLKGQAYNIALHNKENATLFIGTTYALNSTFKRLEVAAYVMLLRKIPGKDDTKVVYANNYYFIDSLDNPSRDQSINKNIWISNNGRLLKDKLTMASSLLSNMIASDISKSSTTPYYDSSRTIKFYDINGPQARGYFVKKQNGYVIVSLASIDYAGGNLYAIKPSMILKDR